MKNLSWGSTKVATCYSPPVLGNSTRHLNSCLCLLELHFANPTHLQNLVLDLGQQSQPNRHQAAIVVAVVVVEHFGFDLGLVVRCPAMFSTTKQVLQRNSSKFKILLMAK